MRKFYKKSRTLLLATVASLAILIFTLSIATSFNSDIGIELYRNYSNFKSRCILKYSRLVLKQPYPIGFISINNVEEKLGSPAEWIMQQINEDFSHYDNFSRQHVLETYESLDPAERMVLFDIRDGMLHVARHADSTFDQACLNGIKIYTNIFEYLANKGYIKNLSFLLRFSDYVQVASEEQMTVASPILTTAKDINKSKEFRFVLIPDYMSLEDIPKFTPRILHANGLSSWSQKENKIFWRGGKADVSGFRHEVVAFSKQHGKSIIDAQFADSASLTYKKDFIQPEAQVKFKYLLNIDGHPSQKFYFGSYISPKFRHSVMSHIFVELL